MFWTKKRIIMTVTETKSNKTSKSNKVLLPQPLTYWKQPKPALFNTLKGVINPIIIKNKNITNKVIKYFIIINLAKKLKKKNQRVK